MTMLYEERFARKMYASYFSFKPAKHVIAYNAKVKKVVSFPPVEMALFSGYFFTIVTFLRSITEWARETFIDSGAMCTEIL